MRKILALAAALALSGCVTVLPGPYDRVDQLRPGETTRAQAEGIMGRPNVVTELGDGSVLLSWTASGLTGYEVASVLFGRDGQMIRVQQKTMGSTF